MEPKVFAQKIKAILRIRLATWWCSFPKAYWPAHWPLRSSAFHGAPRSSSASTVSACPCSAASISALFPSSSSWNPTSAPFLSSSTTWNGGFCAVRECCNQPVHTHTRGLASKKQQRNNTHTNLASPFFAASSSCMFTVDSWPESLLFFASLMLL